MVPLGKYIKLPKVRTGGGEGKKIYSPSHANTGINMGITLNFVEKKDQERELLADEEGADTGKRTHESWEGIQS